MNRRNESNLEALLRAGVADELAPSAPRLIRTLNAVPGAARPAGLTRPRGVACAAVVLLAIGASLTFAPHQTTSNTAHADQESPLQLDPATPLIEEGRLVLDELSGVVHEFVSYLPF